jgi:hypothetical protein
MHTMKATLLAVASVLSVACGPDANLFVPVGDWTDDELAVVEDAMAEWCDKSGGKHCARLGDGTTNREDNSVIALTEDHDDRYGRVRFGYYNLNLVEIDDENYGNEWPVWLRRTVLHELGHHFARRDGHLPAGNVMAACGDEPQALTAADVQLKVSRAYDCD